MIGKLKGNPQKLAELEKSQHLQALGNVFLHIARETLERTPVTLGNWVHPYWPGEEVWVKDWKKELLQPVWTGPHTVVLATLVLLELPVPSLGSATPESRRQTLSVMRTP